MQFFADIWSGTIQDGHRTEVCDILMNNTYANMEWAGLSDLSRKMGTYPNSDNSDRYGNTTIDILSNDRQWHY
jgi:hypothetical protein